MTELGKGNIEHTTLPSGLHLISEDFFGFRHGTSLPSDFSVVGELGDDTTDNGGKGKGDGTWPGVALFRSRENEGGRGRRMVSLGIVLGMSFNLLQVPYCLLGECSISTPQRSDPCLSILKRGNS